MLPNGPGILEMAKNDKPIHLARSFGNNASSVEARADQFQFRFGQHGEMP
jgi:hypothetical protein